MITNFLSLILKFSKNVIIYRHQIRKFVGRIMVQYLSTYCDLKDSFDFFIFLF
ncbi:hypothetical protein RchiOBHm_Chr6g0266731 [Rosa chinensis]|uniref:Uncharacterized protein n=1 Tax=Rosa chinensis TaxID=74649 RepID=A0A2P6PPU5_ROSCH|nr:hypothetical protein RchiOBHm_Chr6g0266731 [Rosa chinensis]